MSTELRTTPELAWTNEMIDSLVWSQSDRGTTVDMAWVTRYMQQIRDDTIKERDAYWQQRLLRWCRRIVELEELLKDRESDLEYEHEERIKAEKKNKK